MYLDTSATTSPFLCTIPTTGILSVPRPLFGFSSALAGLPRPPLKLMPSPLSSFILLSNSGIKVLVVGLVVVPSANLRGLHQHKFRPFQLFPLIEFRHSQ